MSNALSELAERLEVEAKFAQENGRNGRPIYNASRIVAELAKASAAIGYADEFAKDGFKECIYIPATQQLCVKKILKCRAIAEEGVKDV